MSAGEPRPSSDPDILSNIPAGYENLVLVGFKGRATDDLESAPDQYAHLIGRSRTETFENRRYATVDHRLQFHDFGCMEGLALLHCAFRTGRRLNGLSTILCAIEINHAQCPDTALHTLGSYKRGCSEDILAVSFLNMSFRFSPTSTSPLLVRNHIQLHLPRYKMSPFT